MADRILPTIDDRDTAGFFQAAAGHRLVVRGCTACGKAIHPPTAHCPRCGSWATDWRTCAGSGTLHSWSVVRHQVHPAFPVPYTIVVVTIDDAPDVRLVGMIPGAPELADGQPMRVAFETLADGVVLPQWVLA